MNPGTRVTRRATLLLMGSGVVGAALWPFAPTAHAVGFAMASRSKMASLQQPTAPFGGAGLYDVDPDQARLSQSSSVVITGDVAALPEDMEV